MTDTNTVFQIAKIEIPPHDSGQISESIKNQINFPVIRNK